VNPVNLAVTTLVWIYFFPREAAGASSTRHSPRPLTCRWLHDFQNSRGGRGEIVEVCCELSAMSLHSATASPVFIPPPVFGGVETSEACSWGGAKRRVGVARAQRNRPHPSHRSRALTTCHPRASFARLDPTRVGGIRKSELRWTRGRSVAARRPHPSRRRFAPLWMRLIRRACGLILMVRSAATPRVSNHEAGIETEEETMW